MLKRSAAAVGRAATGLALRLRPGAPTRPPWERTVLDDLAMRRPWNLRLKAERLAARRRVGRLTDGVTVVIVNWNTKDVVADVLRAVQRLSPPSTQVLVVDNGSTDGSAEMLRNWAGIDTLLLRSNAGHGVALDLAVLRSTTSVTVTLDSDAVPLREGWLDAAVEPVRSGRAVLCGLRARRNFVHPVYSAVDTRAFVTRRLSFQVHRPGGVADDEVVWGENAWDTAELLTGRLAPGEVVFVERTENPVPGLPGMTTGGVVYHHGGVSRSADGKVSAAALEGWRRACDAVGLGFLRDARAVLRGGGG